MTIGDMAPVCCCIVSLDTRCTCPRARDLVVGMVRLTGSLPPGRGWFLGPKGGHQAAIVLMEKWKTGKMMRLVLVCNSQPPLRPRVRSSGNNPFEPQLAIFWFLVVLGSPGLFFGVPLIAPHHPPKLALLRSRSIGIDPALGFC
jgi:hypothetical protein